MLFDLILGYVKKYKYFLFTITLLSIIAKCINILFLPLILKNIIKGINSGNVNILYYYSYILLYIFFHISQILLYNLLDYIRIHILGKINLIENRTETLKKVLNHSITFFTEKSVGEIKTDIENLGQNIEFIIKPIFFDFIPYVLTLVFYSFYISKFSIYLALFVLVWSFIFSFISTHLSKKVMDSFTEENKEKSIIGGKIGDILINLFAIKSFNNEEHEIENFKKNSIILFNKRKISNKSFMKEDVIVSIVDLTFNTILLFILITCFVKNKINISDFFFLFYSMQTISVENRNFVRWLGITISRIGEAKNNIKITEDKNEIKNKLNAKKLNISNGKIIFKDINFKY